jgi:biotin carboxyl carrier protein
MQYEVEVGGRRRQVSVARTGDGFAVTVDGHSLQVDSARIDAHTLSLLMDSLSPAHNSADGPPNAARVRHAREITIVADPGAGRLTVYVGSTPIEVTLNGLRRRVRQDDGRPAGAGPQRLVAPMPGKVVRVLVKPGDVVAPRQAVVVVEAMKMENELRATREGTVTEVHAHEGVSVDAGALLIVIQ